MSAQSNTNQAPLAAASEPKRPDLDSRYGRIGIPAVAAAMRYPSDARNPAYTPARQAVRDHEDTAA